MQQIVVLSGSGFIFDPIKTNFMAQNQMVVATKNGETKEFGPVQWKRLKEREDGTHEGWRELPAGTVAEAVTFDPPEIAMPLTSVEPTPAPVIDPNPQGGNDDFANVNGQGIQDPGPEKIEPVKVEPVQGTKKKSGPKPKSVK